MKRIFLSNTPLRASQSFATRAIPIGERFHPARGVIDCLHASRKWVARCGAILLSRMRSLLLAQILSGRRHALRHFEKLSTRLSLGSRRAGGSARVFEYRECIRRAAIRAWRTGHTPTVHPGSAAAAHSSPAGFDDRGR